MDRNLMLTAFGALIVSAAGFGAHLGQSAIDQINPLYFQGAAVHPSDRGAVFDESALPPAPRFADLYGWNEGQTARAADCVDCQALAARDAFYESGARYAVAETDWRTQPVAYVVEAEREREAAPAEQAAPAPGPVDVGLYAGFQIEEKPAEAQPVAVAAAEQ